MLKMAARNMPGWDVTRHTLPMHPVTIPAHATVTDSGAVHAIVTAGPRDLREALTLMEVARKISVQSRRAWTCANSATQPRGGSSHAPATEADRHESPTDTRRLTSAARMPQHALHVGEGTGVPRSIRDRVASPR